MFFVDMMICICDPRSHRLEGVDFLSSWIPKAAAGLQVQSPNRVDCVREVCGSASRVDVMKIVSRVKCPRILRGVKVRLKRVLLCS